MAVIATPICTVLGAEKASVIEQALADRFSTEVYVTLVHINGHIGDENATKEYGLRMSLAKTSYTAKEVKAWVNGFRWAKFGE